MIRKIMLAAFTIFLTYDTSDTLAQRDSRVIGRKFLVSTVFDSVGILATGADTSAAIYLGDAQFFSLWFMATSGDDEDSLNLRLQCELAIDSTVWAWDVDSTAASTLIANYSDFLQMDYISPWTIPPAPWSRFIVTGLSSNSASDSTYYWLYVGKQP